MVSGGYLVTSSFLFDSPPSLDAMGPSAEYGREYAAALVMIDAWKNIHSESVSI